MDKDHASTMTNICRYALTCSRPFGRTVCTDAWCFASVLQQPREKGRGPREQPEKPKSDGTDR